MEENHKLIAKIQHFYEVLQRKIDEVNDSAIMQVNDKFDEKHKQNSSDLTYLCDEYSNIFKAFLYTEPQ